MSLSEAKSIFWPSSSAYIHTEKEISDEAGNLYRVDRLIISGQKAALVEFKMGAKQPEDLAQVKKYLHLLKSIYNAHSFSAFIMYFESERVEEIEV
jgi:CRISPR/Cas system-associated exonuclease Cas4 (RecB family)